MSSNDATKTRDKDVEMSNDDKAPAADGAVAVPPPAEATTAAADTPATEAPTTGAKADTADDVPTTATTTKPAAATTAPKPAAIQPPPQQQQRPLAYPHTAPPTAPVAAFPPTATARFPYAGHQQRQAPPPTTQWTAAAAAIPPPPVGMNAEAALRYERSRFSTMEVHFKKEIKALQQRNDELQAKLKLDVQYERTRFNAMELNFKAEIERLMKQAAETETKLKVGQVEQQKLSKSLAAEKKTSAKRKAELSDVKERARKVKKGIPYTKYDAKWNMRYEQLKAYKEIHGNCNLSKRLHRNTQYKELASWVTHQRYEHKCLREGKYTSLNPTRVKLLTQLGFEWRVAANEQMSWDERFMQLLEFQAINGHTRVPQKCEKPPGLGHWVLDQRKYYRRRNTDKETKILTQERIEKLEAIGFEWALRNHTKARAPSSIKKPAPPQQQQQAGAAAPPAGGAQMVPPLPGALPGGMVPPPGAAARMGMPPPGGLIPGPGGMLPAPSIMAPPGASTTQQQNPKNVGV